MKMPAGALFGRPSLVQRELGLVFAERSTDFNLASR